MVRSLKAIEVCTWWSETLGTQQSADPLEIIERWPKMKKITGWTSFCKKCILVSFSDQLLLLTAITHLLTPSIYFYKCQRCPSFYLSISPGKGVVSLPSPWPCYSAAVSLTERPSFCQCLSPTLPPSFFAFFPSLLHPHLPLFLSRSWQLKSIGRAACLLQGEVWKKGSRE